MRGFSLVACVLVLGACAGPPTGLAADLPGSTWVLERIVSPDGGVQRGSGEQVVFGPDGALTVSSCNTCSGRYRVRDGRLGIVEPMACTLKACLGEAIELERYLGPSMSIHREGEYLVVEPLAGAADGPDEAAQLLFLPASPRASG